MAGKWNGFTDDDIKKIQKGESKQVLAGGEGGQAEDAVCVAKRQARPLQGPGRKNVVRERMLQAPHHVDVTSGIVEDIPEEARLVRPEHTQKVFSKTDDSVVCSEERADCGSVVPSGSAPIAVEDGPGAGEECGLGVVGTEVNGSKSVPCSLDEFREWQKMMEEQNRQRKQLLSQVLHDRKKRTKEEAFRLQQIQDELQRLDQQLSNDVSILRNQIEGASIEFMEAQKRYDKAEKEFLNAKLVLFGKLERKELLTEHLCKIIEQNELRKARKLSELMDKLELGVSVQLPLPQGEKQDGAVAMLSPLCSVDEVSYASCNTVKPQQRGGSMPEAGSEPQDEVTAP